MFRDHSLVPTEAIRLAALGFLAEAPRRYGDVANEIRHFTSRVVGPSLDLMGTSLEALRLEGLIEAIDGRGMADNATLRLTAAGRATLTGSLQARLRAPAVELNRLALLLKLRFLHLLSPEEQQAQTEFIRDSCESELARLTDLRRHHAEAPQAFLDWLDQDIAGLEVRLARLSRTPERS
jgi:DNA-binding PadR family transcriptional regulator